MISLCMIVKNEIDVLEKCITSVQKELKNIVTEIVVVDTGSTDGTRELAEKLGCKVYDFEWVNDFSKARNFSISKAKNNWILQLDADEYVTNVDKNELKLLCTNKKYQNTRGFIKVEHVDKNAVLITANRLPRVFNKHVYRFENSIHETIMPIRPCNTQRYNLNMIAGHTGYQHEVYDKKNKVERNKNMILEVLEKNPNDLYMMGQLAIVYKLEGNNEKAIEYFEKSIFNEASVKTEYFTMVVCEYLKLLLKLDMTLSAVICERLWDYCKESDEYIYYMGLAYTREGMIEKAINAFVECVNKTGEMYMDKKFSYQMLGIIFEQIGYTAQAIECYKNYSDDPQTLEKIKMLEAKLNS